MRLSIGPCHKPLLRCPKFGRGPRAPAAPTGRKGDAKWLPLLVIAKVEKLLAGLIFGGDAPIWWRRYRRGEAPFKDYWSDDTKNNSKRISREENRAGQMRPGTARGVRPRRRAAGGDEAVLGARLRGHIVRRPDCRDGDQRVEFLQLVRQ